MSQPQLGFITMRLLLGKAVGGVCGSREDGQKHLICFFLQIDNK